MILYRVENLITNRGLWYNTSDQSDSNLVQELNLTNKLLPMVRTDIISVDHWKSAAESIDQLKYWFTREDLDKLTPLGFNLYEIEVDITKQHTTDMYSHPLFQEIGVKSRKILDIGLIH